jgi:site-specific DNA-methyltransferase (adenine-specific)
MITLHKGDCLDVINDVDDNTIDAIITDPPYGYLDHKLDADFDYKDLFLQYKRVLKPNGGLVIFGRGVMLAKWVVYLDEIGFKFKEEVVWDKRMITSPCHVLGRKHELAIVFGLGKFKINKVMIDYVQDKIDSGEIEHLKSTIKGAFDAIYRVKDWQEFESWRNLKPELEEIGSGSEGYNITGYNVKSPSRAFSYFQSLKTGGVLKSVISVARKHYDTIHPTQKPQPLLEKIVQLVTNEGDTILDTFGGSGTLGLACHNLDRDVILIEKDDEYFEASTKYISEELGLFKNQLVVQSSHETR